MIPWPLLIAGLLLLGGGAVAAVYLLAPTLAERQARERVAPPADRQRDVAPLLSRLLARTGLLKRLQWELVRANLLLRPSEVVASAAGAAVLGWALGFFLLKSVLLGLLLAGAGLSAPWMAISVRKAQRLKQLTAQLPGALGMLASALRSGYSLLRALEVVAQEMEPPVSEEFRRVLDETAVGYPLDQALTNLVQRTQSADVKLVVTAMQVQAQVGGNLAEILDKTAAMIRERFQLAAEVSALTAEGRLSVSVLVGMPIAVAVLINLVSPGYLAPLFTEPLGRLMLGGAATMLITGVLIVKRMLSVQI